jgi:hypothetical protein
MKDVGGARGFLLAEQHSSIGCPPPASHAHTKETFTKVIRKRTTENNHQCPTTTTTTIHKNNNHKNLNHRHFNRLSIDIVIEVPRLQ